MCLLLVVSWTREFISQGKYYGAFYLANCSSEHVFLQALFRRLHLELCWWWEPSFCPIWGIGVPASWYSLPRVDWNQFLLLTSCWDNRWFTSTSCSCLRWSFSLLLEACSMLRILVVEKPLCPGLVQDALYNCQPASLKYQFFKHLVEFTIETSSLGHLFVGGFGLLISSPCQ